MAGDAWASGKIDRQAGSSYFSVMTLQFQLRREDIVAFILAFYATSPTYQKTRARVRWVGPAVMALFEVILTMGEGFQWPRTLLFAVIGVAFFLRYPRRFDASVRKQAEQFVKEPGCDRMLGACTLTLSEEGLHAVWPTGTSSYTWDAVTDVRLTQDYLHLFLGFLGYPIQIADIGREAAGQAFTFANQHRGQRAGA